MVPLPLWKCILKVLPRFHFEYFSNIPLIAGASIIVEMYLDGCAATVCVVFFKFIICRRYISLGNCIMRFCRDIIHRTIRCIQFRPQFYRFITSLVSYISILQCNKLIFGIPKSSNHFSIRFQRCLHARLH